MQDMIKLIHKLSYRHSSSKIYADFVEMSAIAISNSVDKGQFEQREKRYLEIVRHYNKEEVNEFPNLLGMLVMHLEEKPRDVLGELFHALELHNKFKGQFFTPDPICRFMAQIVIGDGKQDIIDQYGFITVCEPACGTGAMIIGVANELKSRGVNYQQSIHVTATDLDSTCVHAAYVQFSLLHIPAVVIHGNSLSLEEFSHWFTPAHAMGLWTAKLVQKRKIQQFMELVTDLGKNDSTHNENSPATDDGKTMTDPLVPLGTQLKLF